MSNNSKEQSVFKFKRGFNEPVLQDGEIFIDKMNQALIVNIDGKNISIGKSLKQENVSGNKVVTTDPDGVINTSSRLFYKNNLSIYSYLYDAVDHSVLDITSLNELLDNMIIKNTSNIFITRNYNNQSLRDLDTFGVPKTHILGLTIHGRTDALTGPYNTYYEDFSIRSLSYQIQDDNGLFWNTISDISIGNNALERYWNDCLLCPENLIPAEHLAIGSHALAAFVISMTNASMLAIGNEACNYVPYGDNTISIGHASSRFYHNASKCIFLGVHSGSEKHTPEAPLLLQAENSIVIGHYAARHTFDIRNSIVIGTECLSNSERNDLSNCILIGNTLTTTIPGLPSGAQNTIYEDRFSIGGTITGRLINLDRDNPVPPMVAIGDNYWPEYTLDVQGDIHAKDNIYINKELLELNHLNNVLINAPVNHDVLSYDSVTSKWTNRGLGNISGGLTFMGTWNSVTNLPALSLSYSLMPANGSFYIVSDGGGTFNGITWNVGDWIMCVENEQLNEKYWIQIANSNLVTSVFGRVGNITAQTGDYDSTQITYTYNHAITEQTVSTSCKLMLDTLRIDKLDSSLFTAGNILTMIKTVDGHTCGLDSDLLDGYHASDFALANHNHGGTALPAGAQFDMLIYKDNAWTVNPNLVQGYDYDTVNALSPNSHLYARYLRVGPNDISWKNPDAQPAQYYAAIPKIELGFKNEMATGCVRLTSDYREVSGTPYGASLLASTSTAKRQTFRLQLKNSFSLVHSGQTTNWNSTIDNALIVTAEGTEQYHINPDSPQNIQAYPNMNARVGINIPNSASTKFTVIPNYTLDVRGDSYASEKIKSRKGFSVANLPNAIPGAEAWLDGETYEVSISNNQAGMNLRWLNLKFKGGILVYKSISRYPETLNEF